MFSKLMDETHKGKVVYEGRTICEVHREIYDVLVIELATTRPDVIEKIVPLLEESFLMGVKMNKALAEHKLSQDYTEKPTCMEKSKVLRKERIRLIKMLDENNQILNEYTGDKPK